MISSDSSMSLSKHWRETDSQNNNWGHTQIRFTMAPLLPHRQCCLSKCCLSGGVGWTGTNGLLTHVGTTLCEWSLQPPLNLKGLFKSGPQAAQPDGSLKKSCQGLRQRDWLIHLLCTAVFMMLLSYPPQASSLCPQDRGIGGVILPASHTPGFQRWA